MATPVFALIRPTKVSVVSTQQLQQQFQAAFIRRDKTALVAAIRALRARPRLRLVTGETSL